MRRINWKKEEIFQDSVPQAEPRGQAFSFVVMPAFYHTDASGVNTPWDTQRLGWLLLASFPLFGPRSYQKIRRTFQNQKEICAFANREQYLQAGLKSSVVDAYLEFRSQTNPTNLAQICDSQNIRFTLIDDPDYPSILKEIYDPPTALFHRGPLPTSAGISIVGTRRITNYGERVTRDFVERLLHLSYPLISGLAQGIDATVHRTANELGCATIAILPGGIDDASIQPRAHITIAKNLLEHGGSLVSELPPGTEALRHSFPLRNRIISGLSTATIVIEAAIKSGSLITARLALEQNRDVFAVPGPIFSDVSAGCHLLLRDGAHLATSVDDILAVLHPEVMEKLDASVQSKQTHIDLQLFPLHQQAILKELTEPTHIDDLSRELSRSITDLTNDLLSLELAGIIDREPGNIVRLH